MTFMALSNDQKNSISTNSQKERGFVARRKNFPLLKAA